ncbi:tetratricopeptide repeat protein [Streptomyces sp. NPDC048277]|uniref:tetratricopeptide repeat protein n=1 Tax=Streptomyces sp. NPDC048277 TaxID=3155027 RepID=UPI003407B9FC
MSRLSSKEQREVQEEGCLVPVDVRVADRAASVDGVPLLPGPGEEPQHAVLNHLHHLARTTGRPVLATVQDTRIGYVVSLRVNLDGSSSFTGDPVRMTASAEPKEPAPAAEPERQPRRDRSAPLLRAVDEPAPVRDAAPSFPLLRAVPEPPAPPAPAVPPAPAPGTVQAPTGSFGPPPVMSALVPAPALAPAPASAPDPVLLGEPLVEREPDPRHTPARGFDAVAEEVLGDEPVTVTAEGAALLTEPMARINEAVRAGRIEAAAELAERTVAEASAILGDRHTEVLHLRELTAYIAYLAGDPLRAFHLSLDLARQRRQARDAEGAYGNVRSAATAWRAVRDPEHGLRLGHDLIDLWTQLTTEDGPAADEPDELESARARMARLTERARRAAENK